MSGTRRKPGRLGPFVDGYRGYLLERGYTPATVRNQLVLLGALGRWMDREDRAVERLDRAMVSDCLAEHRWEHGWARSQSPVTLLAYLSELGMLASPGPARLTAVDQLVGEYRDWMISERGLAEQTVRGAVRLALVFLSEHARAGDLVVEQITSAEVIAFLVRESRRVSAGTVRLEVGQLRRLLRYLGMRGVIDPGVADAVPSIAGWRETTIPQFPQRPAVAQLLGCCDRSRDLGVRDFAILTLLVRLGLRAIEIARLELDDVDWRAGEIEIDGKGHDRARLPLPSDIGEALVAHLRHRGQHRSRRVFLTARAPRRPIDASGIRTVVRSACVRAGIERIPAHRLRHSLASELLADGASLTDIGQVLRHRHLESTARYAKVDLDRLREAAGPWPGALR